MITNNIEQDLNCISEYKHLNNYRNSKSANPDIVKLYEDLRIHIKYYPNTLESILRHSRNQRYSNNYIALRLLNNPQLFTEYCNTSDKSLNVIELYHKYNSSNTL